MPADCSKWTVVKQPKITTLRGLYPPICPGRAVSSVVEHYLDTVGVTGSNPVSRIFESRECITLNVTMERRRFLRRLTMNLRDRFTRHTAGRVSATAYRRPVILEYSEACCSEANARRRE